MMENTPMHENPEYILEPLYGGIQTGSGTEGSRTFYWNRRNPLSVNDIVVSFGTLPEHTTKSKLKLRKPIEKYIIVIDSPRRFYEFQESSRAYFGIRG